MSAASTAQTDKPEPEITDEVKLQTVTQFLKKARYSDTYVPKLIEQIGLNRLHDLIAKGVVYEPEDDEKLRVLADYYHSIEDELNRYNCFLLEIQKNWVGTMEDCLDYFDHRHHDSRIFAEALCDKIIVDTDRESQYSYAGDKYLKWGRFEKAERAYLKAIELGEKDYHKLVSLYSKSDNKEKHKKYLELCAGKGHAECLVTLGESCLGQQDIPKAFDYFRKAKEGAHEKVQKAVSDYLDNNTDLTLFLEFEDVCTKRVKDKYHALIEGFFSVSKLEAEKIEHIKKKYRADRCCICFDEVPQACLNCRHTVCFSCVPKINKCPVCRQA